MNPSAAAGAPPGKLWITMTVPSEDHHHEELRRAIFKAIKKGDCVGLLTLLRAAEGKNISVLSCCRHGGSEAVCNGDTDCLRVLHMCGFTLVDLTRLAASLGHVHCLAFAVSSGYLLRDYALEQAVQNGQLACVDFLIRHGLPRKPYKHPGGRVNPGTLKCMQLMADRGVHIDPATMIAAVECGDLGFVRWLHRHGLPLWKHAVQGEGKLSTRVNWSIESDPEKLLIPAQTWRVEGMWKPLRYGAFHGAPITPIVKRVFDTKRQRSLAALTCFKVMERQGKPALPAALVKEILSLADLEIRETVWPLASSISTTLPY